MLFEKKMMLKMIMMITIFLFQILCARGYTDQLSGLSGSLVLLCGTLASFPMGLLAYKTGRPVLICKISSLFVIGSMVSLAYFMCVPDQGIAIAFRYFLFSFRFLLSF